MRRKTDEENLRKMNPHYFRDKRHAKRVILSRILRIILETGSDRTKWLGFISFELCFLLSRVTCMGKFMRLRLICDIVVDSSSTIMRQLTKSLREAQKENRTVASSQSNSRVFDRTLPAFRLFIFHEIVHRVSSVGAAHFRVCYLDIESPLK